MTKRKSDKYEECLREYISGFHSKNFAKKVSLVKEISRNNKEFGRGYAYGLRDAVLHLEETAKTSGIESGMGFESIDLEQLNKVIEEKLVD